MDATLALEKKFVLLTHGEVRLRIQLVEYTERGTIEHSTIDITAEELGAVLEGQKPL